MKKMKAPSAFAVIFFFGYLSFLAIFLQPFLEIMYKLQK